MEAVTVQKNIFQNGTKVQKLDIGEAHNGYEIQACGIVIRSGSTGSLSVKTTSNGKENNYYLVNMLCQANKLAKPTTVYSPICLFDNWPCKSVYSPLEISDKIDPDFAIFFEGQIFVDFGELMQSCNIDQDTSELFKSIFKVNEFKQTAEEQNLSEKANIVTKVKEGIGKYKNWFELKGQKDDRSYTPGFFTFYRHSSGGQKRAAELRKQLESSDKNAEDKIQSIINELKDPKARLEIHSLNTYILDALFTLQNSDVKKSYTKEERQQMIGYLKLHSVNHGSNSECSLEM